MFMHVPFEAVWSRLRARANKVSAPTLDELRNPQYTPRYVQYDKVEEIPTVNQPKRSNPSKSAPIGIYSKGLPPQPYPLHNEL